MFIATFKSSYPSQYLFLLFLAILLWLPAFINPPVIEVETCIISPLAGFMASFYDLWPQLPVFLGFLLLVLSGFLINLVMIQSDLISKNSLIPAMVYIFAMSSDPQALTLNGELIANVFILLLLSTVYPMYEEVGSLSPYLSAGLLVAMASAFFFPALLILIFIYFILWIYRTFTWREWLIPLIGFIIPYLYLFAHFFWTDGAMSALQCYGNFFENLFSRYSLPETHQILAIGSLVVLFLIPALFRIFTGLSSYNIAVRKKLSATTWLLSITIVIGLSIGNLFHFSLYWVPASILMAHHIDLIRQKWWHEMLIILIFAGLVIHNFLVL